VVVGVGLGGFSPCKDVMPQNAGAKSRKLCVERCGERGRSWRRTLMVMEGRCEEDVDESVKGW